MFDDSFILDIKINYFQYEISMLEVMFDLTFKGERKIKNSNFNVQI